MSSRLSDLVAQAMEEATVDGRCDTAKAQALLRESLTDEHVDRALNEFSASLISRAARRAMREFASTAASQGELPFRLHAAYAVDLDGRRIVNTADMTRIEARRALEIRRQQIEADQRSANDLARAIAAADPFWDEAPDLTFGEAMIRAALAASEDRSAA